MRRSRIRIVLLSLPALPSVPVCSISSPCFHAKVNEDSGEFDHDALLLSEELTSLLTFVPDKIAR